MDDSTYDVCFVNNIIKSKFLLASEMHDNKIIYICNWFSTMSLVLFFFLSFFFLSETAVATCNVYGESPPKRQLFAGWLHYSIVSLLMIDDRSG